MSVNPAIVFPHTRLQAQMYFTLEKLGRKDLHDKLYDWVTDPEHFPIYHTVIHPDEDAIFSSTSSSPQQTASTNDSSQTSTTPKT
jgi:hypothetical protein